MKTLACYSSLGNTGNNMSTYSYILIFSVIIPFLYSFHPKIKFYKKWPSFFLSTLVIAPLFIAWDIVFTKMGIWGFNHLHISDLKINNLPIEECLFFIAIPYCCIFTYEVLKEHLAKFYSIKRSTILIMALILFICSIFSIDKSYTFSILIGNSIVFLIIYLLRTPLEKMLNSFFILLIPFMIVNGLLTGSFIEEEVVWYNNAENCNIRIGTIPIEDSFYFLLLFFSQIMLYEYFKKINFLNK